MTIQSIKSIIIIFYTKILNRPGYIEELYSKWKSEGKEFFYSNLINKSMTIEEIIYNEMYQITETDILICSYYMNIPVCILYQSKQKIKLTYFTKYKKHNFTYFIKVNHDNSMYLHTIKNL